MMILQRTLIANDDVVRGPWLQMMILQRTLIADKRTLIADDDFAEDLGCGG